MGQGRHASVSAVVPFLLATLLLKNNVSSLVIPSPLSPKAGVGRFRCRDKILTRAKKNVKIFRQSETREHTQQYSFPPTREMDSKSYDQEQRTARMTKLRQVSNAALLIAGTTVGGGFLALPTVVAPNGFVPSAVALVGVWAFFWMESMVLVECLLLSRRIAQLQVRGTNVDVAATAETEYADMETNESPSASIEADVTPGVAAAAKAAFGPLGEKIVVILLVLLIEATLVSQISRAGSFFSSYRAGCTTVAIAAAMLVFGTPKHVVAGTNSILTLVFCIMAVFLFGTGSPAADWSKLGMFSSWSSLPQAIPTFLQLLVYGEILPSVCEMLNYRLGPIRWAVTIGSILPLVLEVGWAALGIGLLPTASGGAGLGMTTDPVNLLLASGPVQGPLFALAVTAISTTIIGSYLALQSAMNDVLAPSTASSDDIIDTVTPMSRPSQQVARGRRRLILSAGWIVLPALAIASISPNLFLQAIDFAGSYPVILLWGLAPPAIAFRLRRKLKAFLSKTSSSTPKIEAVLPAWWLLSLATLSLVLFGMSAIPDLMYLMGFIKHIN